MWPLTLRDLRYRRRRFIIAIAGTALVFGMTLIMSGMSAGFRVEADRTLAAIGGDAWLVPEGVAGPFTGFGTIPAALAADVIGDPHVRRAAPIVVLRHTLDRDGRDEDINVIGHPAAGLGEPPVVAGRNAIASGEAVVDTKLDLPLGARFEMHARTFTVVGHVDGVTYLGGIPTVFVRVEDAQALAYNGQPFATAIVMEGTPLVPPAGFRALSRDDARTDMMRPLANGIRTIDTVQMLLWLVAATIVGAVVYLSALERVRDFAVLKAIGASTRKLFGSLATQSIVVAILAAAVGSVLASVLAPMFPLPIEIPARAFALLPVAALAVGFAASLSGLKRAIDVDPARAFGSP